MDTVYKPCAPELLYLDDAAWEAAVADHRVVQLSPLPQSPGAGRAGCGGRGSAAASRRNGSRKTSAFSGRLADHLQASCARPAGRHRLLVRRRARTAEGAADRSGHEGRARRSRISATCPRGRAGFILMIWALEAGFTAPGLAVISEQDVLGDRLVCKPAQEAQGRQLPARGRYADAGRSGGACRTWRRALSGAGDDHRAGRAA